LSEHVVTLSEHVVTLSEHVVTRSRHIVKVCAACRGGAPACVCSLIPHDLMQGHQPPRPQQRRQPLCPHSPREVLWLRGGAHQLWGERQSVGGMRGVSSVVMLYVVDLYVMLYVVNIWQYVVDLLGTWSTTQQGGGPRGSDAGEPSRLTTGTAGSSGSWMVTWSTWTGRLVIYFPCWKCTLAAPGVW